MEYYDDDTIEEIISKIDLLEYAEKSYSFVKKSESYFTNCPKHVDITPSLSITPEKNLFHCFSCGIGGNILNWLMEYENLSFVEALNKAARLANVSISSLKTPSAMKLFSQLKEKQDNNKSVDRTILDISYLNDFSKETPKEWENEGIDREIMSKYNIMVDNKANRIVYPVYDKEFNLLGVKGRTKFENYKQLGIQKYMNYQKIGTTDFFIGMKENKKSIINKSEMIVFEGIKSGMKAEKWGFSNWVASETSCLNDEQIKIILMLKIKDLVIAYDNDVLIEKIDDCTKMLRKFINVYYVLDKKYLLGDKTKKMSPVDCGEEVWKTLYEGRVRRN